MIILTILCIHMYFAGDLLDSSDVRSNDIISGAQIHMDVWSMWRTLVIAISSGDMEAVRKYTNILFQALGYN